MSLILFMMMIRFCFALFCFACASLACRADAPLPSADEPSRDYPFVFRGGEDGYKIYRIPTLIKSKKGTLIALIEGRVNGIGDAGDIDIVAKRSTDGGKTWSKLIKVRDYDKHTAGNPSAAVDPKSGRIYLVSCASKGSEHQNLKNEVPREIMFQYSDNDGKTWSKAKDISAQANKPEWGWYATGPCNAIVIQEGKYAGRILVPANMSEMVDGKPVYRGISLFSDDKGKTWKTGSVSEDGANESTIAEVGPDLVVQNFRMQAHGEARRWQRFSTDGGETWSPIEKIDSLYCCTCQGSLIRDARVPERLYFSNPARWGRNDMTIYRSDDGGKTWPNALMVHQGPASYSNLIDIDADTLGIIYEGGVKHAAAEGSIFLRVKKADIENSTNKLEKQP